MLYHHINNNDYAITKLLKILVKITLVTDKSESELNELSNDLLKVTSYLHKEEIEKLENIVIKDLQNQLLQNLKDNNYANLKLILQETLDKLSQNDNQYSDNNIKIYLIQRQISPNSLLDSLTNHNNRPNPVDNYMFHPTIQQVIQLLYYSQCKTLQYFKQVIQLVNDKQIKKLFDEEKSEGDLIKVVIAKGCTPFNSRIEMQ